MDQFDTLSNNELRDQLKARGLGNFPVTDTTRNLLIKKLRNAVNGPAKPVKGRRETISVVKHSSAEESESDADAKKPKPKAVSNRRTTIAAAAPKTVQNNATNGDAVKSAAVRPKSPSRKSAAPKAASESVQLKYFADNSDDDLVAAAEAAESRTEARKSSRTSRSPSLTKSSVVTTSYKHTIEPLVELNDDVVLLDDESDAEFNSNMVEKVRKATPTTKISAPSDNRRKTMQLGPSVTTITATTPKPAEQYTAREDTTSAYRRRYTTNAPIANRTTGGAESDEDVLKRVETPFLSDFTRRLAELKATPLAGLDKYDDYKSPKLTTSAYSLNYRSSAQGYNRFGESTREKSLVQQEQKPEPAWSSIEKKIRRPLLILLAFFIIISIYVFFFAENF